MYFKNNQRRSALVDLVMKDAAEEERIEATRHWFGFLETLLKIAREIELKEQRGETPLVTPPVEGPDHRRPQA